MALLVPAAAAGDPAPESVIGSGTVLATQFALSVAGGPFGENPSGTMTLQGFFNFTATPTCMNIADNAGVVGFRIDDGSQAGQGFLAASEPDTSGRTVQYSAVLAAPPTACPPDDAPTPPDAIENGGGGGVFAGQITDGGGPPSPLPLSHQAFPAADAPTGARAIAQAQDGTVWFTEPGADRLVSITDDASGTTHAYALPTPGAGLSSISPDVSRCPAGCAGDMWFTEAAANQIGRVSATGSISEYPLPNASARPSAISGDPNGGAWFTEPGTDRVGHVSPTGAVNDFVLPTRGAQPIAIAATSGGAWFAEEAARQIGFIDERGAVREFSLPPGAGAPTAVADGGGGAWFLEPTTNTVGHIDSVGDINQYPLPTPDASPQGLVAGAGPDASSGGAWFSEPDSGQLGYISAGGQFSQFNVPGASPESVAFVPTIDLPATDGYSQYEGVWWTDPVASDVGVASFPLDGSSAGPLVPPPPPPSYVAVSLARRLTVRASRIGLTLRCQGERGRCGGQVAVAVARLRAARRTPPFARASFSIVPGHHRAYVLRMNRSGRRLLRAHRRGLPVTVNITAGHRFTASTRTAILRLP